VPVQRRTIALDAGLVSELKNVASRRGSTLAGYLRRLLRAVIALERQGIDPFQVLENAYMYEVLTSLGAVPAPVKLLRCCRRDCVESELEEFMKTMKDLGVDGWGLLQVIARSLRAPQGGGTRILLPRSHEGAGFALIIAKVYGYTVRFTGDYVVIEQKPQEERTG